ncbi:hypothetical protein EJD97_016630 [Solanum chilense]|uniref:Uncharacterized protein n=1 Tax=Solanum chilense TaxID=4083 RepID=A0A6N2AG65_SOLCI|nr:hypothetical protein EJD97_016630 [Solanum chilense]
MTLDYEQESTKNCTFKTGSRQERAHAQEKIRKINNSTRMIVNLNTRQSINRREILLSKQSNSKL